MILRVAVYNMKDPFTVGHRLPDVPPQLPRSSEGCLSQVERYIQLILGLATHWTFSFSFNPAGVLGLENPEGDSDCQGK